jgi:redox-regulated HSP33 family molecular chaperone
MQRVMKRHHYILLTIVLVGTILAAMALMTVSVKGQCPPNDLLCITMP